MTTYTQRLESLAMIAALRRVSAHVAFCRAIRDGQSSQEIAITRDRWQACKARADRLRLAAVRAGQDDGFADDLLAAVA